MDELTQTWANTEEGEAEESKEEKPAAVIETPKKPEKPAKSEVVKKEVAPRGTLETMCNALTKNGGYRVNGKLVDPDGKVISAK